MQVVVKTPRIRIEGEIPAELVNYLREHYGDVEVIEQEDDELIEVKHSEWYREARETITSGENLRVYRELHGFSQQELGERLGGLPKQHISNMETGQRAISKSMAKQLAEVFNVSVEKFI
jgi:DNA-binding XRE family transcriptional regulator